MDIDNPDLVDMYLAAFGGNRARVRELLLSTRTHIDECLVKLDELDAAADTIVTEPIVDADDSDPKGSR